MIENVLKIKRFLSHIAFITLFIFYNLFPAGCLHIKQAKLFDYKTLSKDEYKVRILKDIMVSMEDGIRLATDIYLPKTSEKVPAILIRTPYSKDLNMDLLGKFFASRGYAFVVQDVRGKFKSEGIFIPFVNEGKDGDATISWVCQQEWCNGKIGLAGGSYFGINQWLAMKYKNPCVYTMVPTICSLDFYNSVGYTGGALNLLLNLGWNYVSVGRYEMDFHKVDWDTAFRHLPLIEADDFLGKDVDFYDEILKHPQPDEFWAKLIDAQYEDIEVPVLMATGWYDIFAKAQMQDFLKLREGGGSELARGKSVIIVGPWGHGFRRTKVGEINFGPSADGIHIYAAMMQWFDHWLKGMDNNVPNWGPIRYFTMGYNVWRDTDDFPFHQTEYKNLYFISQKGANSLKGDGFLSWNMPETEKIDEFLYDPENPVPTVGGFTLGEIIDFGPMDQRKVEMRDDVLVYTSEKLITPIEITGPVKVILYASTDAPDTDFTAKLVDVHPSGKAYMVLEGIIRGRYYKSLTQPELLTPGNVYQFEIDLGITSIAFLKNHRIRVEISSSNFPRFDRNLNTGGVIGLETEFRKARQKVYCSPDYPSHIVLPIVQTSL